MVSASLATELRKADPASPIISFVVSRIMIID